MIWWGKEKARKGKNASRPPFLGQSGWKNQRKISACLVRLYAASRIRSDLLGVQKKVEPPSATSSCRAINTAATGRAELGCSSYSSSKSKYHIMKKELKVEGIGIRLVWVKKKIQ